jgi:GntR family transcriptional regulator, rspAB operon transcriptional repressor
MKGGRSLHAPNQLLIVDTLTNRIATLVREMITDLKPGFEPGARINPRELAQLFGVSETPLKLALQELASQGLVEIFPRRGTYVAKLSRRDVDELVDVRSGLEVMALRLTGGRLLESVLDQMLQGITLCEQALEEGDSELYRANDAKFHRLIVQASGNRRLEQMYELLTGSVQILNVYNPRHHLQQAESQAEHRQLVAVFRQGDLAASEAALALHWSTSKTRLVHAYSPYLDTHDDQV